MAVAVYWGARRLQERGADLLLEDIGEIRRIRPRMSQNGSRMTIGKHQFQRSVSDQEAVPGRRYSLSVLLAWSAGHLRIGFRSSHFPPRSNGVLETHRKNENQSPLWDAVISLHPVRVKSIRVLATILYWFYNCAHHEKY